MEGERFTGSTSTTVIIEAPEERNEQVLKQDGPLDEAGKLHKELFEKKFRSSGKGTEQVELPQNKKSEAANTNETNERTVNIRRNPVNATDSHHVGIFDCNNRAQGTGCDIEDNKVDSKDSQFVGVFNCGNESKKSEAANTKETNESSGKGTEQVELPQNKKRKAANTNETNESSGKGTEQVELPQNKKRKAANTNETNDRPASIRENLINATDDSDHVGVFDCNNRDQGTGCNIENNNIDSKSGKFVGVFNCGNKSKKPN